MRISEVKLRKNAPYKDSINLLFSFIETGNANEFQKYLVNVNKKQNLPAGIWDLGLQCAVIRNQLEIVELLLEKGANLAKASNQFIDVEAMHVAIWSGNAREFIPCQTDQPSALLLAIVNDYSSIVSLFLDQKRNSPKGFLSEAAEANFNPLVLAAWFGSNKTLQVLLSSGMHFDPDANVGSPLHAAALQGHYNTVRLLVERKAEIDNTFGKYGTPLCAASLHGHERVVDLLITRGADIDKTTASMPRTPIQIAFIYAYPKIICALVAAGAQYDPSEVLYHWLHGENAQDRDKSGKVFEAFLQRAKMEIVGGKELFNALCIAAGTGNYQSVTLLLNREGNQLKLQQLKEDELEQLGKHGPLELAVEYGYDNISGMLLMTSIPSLFRGTPFCTALDMGHWKIVNQFIQYGRRCGLDFNELQECGCGEQCGATPRTPLSLAISLKQYQLGIELIEQGADPFFKGLKIPLAELQRVYITCVELVRLLSNLPPEQILT